MPLTHRAAAIASTLAIAWALPVHAGETPLYAPAPDWVDEMALDTEAAAEGPAEVLVDAQYRLEDGIVHSFYDRAIRLDTPAALTEQGTLQATWYPDKGDLTVHRLEILRGSEVIDLVAEGVEFDVIRREEGLEQRLMDGQLTATLAVPGLQQGDVLRLSYGMTLADQALGDEVQVAQYLGREPWRVGQARILASWPKDEEMFWAISPLPDGNAQLADLWEEGGIQKLRVDLPVPEAKDMPGDAPSRFHRSSWLSIGSFDSWQDLSRVMAPHFEESAVIDPNGAVASEIARIAAETDDPIERMALATRIVQDRISYLLDGLDGGNYLPQAADDTWDKAYGDCKAKSVLLLAMLRQLGIESQVVLVTSQGGDALPELLPLPANFDHMIVRANIDGTDYWLDGTSAATRLTNIAEVPAFYHALPLTVEGADLVAMTQRPQPWPDSITTIAVDATAGIDLPILTEFTIEMFGPRGISIQRLANEADEKLLKRVAASVTANATGSMIVTDIDIKYDEDAAKGTFVVNGIADASFAFEGGKMREAVSLSTDDFVFAPDRARPAWRQIPVATPGPARVVNDYALTLPDDGAVYRLVGDTQFSGRAANTSIEREATISGNRVHVREEILNELGEISGADIATEKRAAMRVANADLFLESAGEVTWRWDLEPDEMKRRVAPLAKAYDKVVADANADDYAPLAKRARFHALVFEYEKALADYDVLVAENTSVGVLLERASVHQALGHMEEALSDVSLAYELQPDNGLGFYQSEILADMGRFDEALELLGLLPIGEEERDALATTTASALGLAGRKDEGLALLAERREAGEPDADLLNSDCWYRGIHDVALEDALAGCTKAIERAANAAPALDSRAMVHFKLGNYDAALADLEAALDIVPSLVEARFMRGVVRLETGDDDGRSDIESALRERPALAEKYARYGVAIPD